MTKLKIVTAYYRWSTGIYFYLYIEDGTEEKYQKLLDNYAEEDYYV